MYIVGIDEAGRGALAGPVVVAAVIMPKGFYPKSRTLPKLKDSKRLSPAGRDAWFEYVKEHPQISFATARVYPRGIERNNITNSANLAALCALNRLLAETGTPKDACRVLIDGGLYVKSADGGGIYAETHVRGDQKFVSIKLASIAAKVTRDAYMVRLHGQIPAYEFKRHKGYGTLLHRRLIKTHGASGAHRATFLEKILD